jgi:hypothetical protein
VLQDELQQLVERVRSLRSTAVEGHGSGWGRSMNSR